MKVVEIKVIFDSDSIEDTQKEICDIFYGFGATGLKIDEPLKTKNPLDFYKDEKQFLMVDYAVSAYFPMNSYSLQVGLTTNFSLTFSGYRYFFQLF